MVKKKTHEEFVKEVHTLTKDEYIILDKYIGAREKIKFKHNIESCNYEFEMMPNSFLFGHRCPKCAKNQKRTTENFKEIIKEKYNDEYIVIGEYINSGTKIKMKHKCGHEYETFPNDIIQNKSHCPKCSSNFKKNTEIFKKEVYELEKDDYKVLGEYINNRTKISIKHNIKDCNEIYDVLPKDFIHGYRCPYCNESKGEKRIKQFLNNNSIEYIQQFTFEDCKYKTYLPFDFAILKDNNLKLLIEYDGEQHFSPVFGQKSYNNTIRNDKIKNNYCVKNNIRLIRINYTDFNNIENILLNIIN